MCKCVGGPKFIIQQRDLIVGNNDSRLSVSKMNKISSFGSSRILSKAFWDSRFSFSASETITTFFESSGAEIERFDLSSRIKSIVISFARGSFTFR